METVILKIEGMACGGCVATVKAALERVPGVESVDVVLEEARATIVFDPLRASSAALGEAVAAAGYRAESL